MLVVDDKLEKKTMEVSDIMMYHFSKNYSYSSLFANALPFLLHHDDVMSLGVFKHHDH